MDAATLVGIDHGIDRGIHRGRVALDSDGHHAAMFDRGVHLMSHDSRHLRHVITRLIRKAEKRYRVAVQEMLFFGQTPRQARLPGIPAFAKTSHCFATPLDKKPFPDYTQTN